MTFSDAELEDVLKHFGVKGMHWGVRNDRSSEKPETRQQSIAKINKKIGKLDPETAVSGIELKGWAIKKQYKKAIKKDPTFKYGKLSPAEKAAYQHKASQKVTHTLMRRGAFEVGVVLAGTGLILKSGLSPKAKQGAAISSILLAGQIGKTRISDIHSVRVADKLESLQSERDKLQRAQRRSTVKIKPAP